MSKATELRSLDEVLAEIRETFSRDGIKGVQGFSITVRCRISSVNLKWGDTRLRKAKP